MSQLRLFSSPIQDASEGLIQRRRSDRQGLGRSDSSMSRPPISSPLPQSGPSSYGQLQQQQQQQQSQPSYQGHHPASSYDHLGGMPRSVSSTSHMSAAAAAGPSRAAVRSSHKANGQGLLADRVQPNVLDSNITRLLVTTKQLLQGLEHWASGQISEEDVSRHVERDDFAYVSLKRCSGKRHLCPAGQWL